MKIELQAEGLVPDRALRGFVKRRIAYALGTMEDEIELVQVRLVDVNEALGGRDKSCRVQISFGGRFKAMVEAMGTDLDDAIHRAVDRAGWAVSCKLQRGGREATDMSNLMYIEGHRADRREPDRAA